MTTKLEKRVERGTDLQVEGKSVLVSLDKHNDEPVIVMRLKGNSKGWIIRLQDMLEHLVHFKPSYHTLKLKEPSYGNSEETKKRSA